MTRHASINAPGSTRARSQGLTFIELMAVVAIISVLAVVALATYNQYVVRSKVAEGLVFAAEAKTSVSEHFYSNNRMPIDNYEAGLPAPGDYDQYEFIERLDIVTVNGQGGVIELTLKIPELGSDNILHLVPSTIDIPVGWKCTPAAVNGVPIDNLPASCRLQ
ncbi:MAG: pilin [Halioglobus sp.]|nr:pilin [Halioglobus sp.]